MTDIDKIKLDLIELKSELEALDSADAGDTVVLDQSKVGRLSRMDAMQQQQMAAASVVHVKAHLNRVCLALAAMESGEFGCCRQCDEPIAFPRLKIRPDSPLCMPCQQALE